MLKFLGKICTLMLIILVVGFIGRCSYSLLISKDFSWVEEWLDYANEDTKD